MGFRAVQSHAVGVKHKRNLESIRKSVDIQNFIKPPPPPPKARSSGPGNSLNFPSVSSSISPNISTASKSSANAGRTTMKDYGFSNKLLEKEVLWCLAASSANLSNRQAEKFSKSFSSIFDDSKLAEKFSVDKDKMAYICSHSLYPYFREGVEDKFSTADFFSVSYDELLNKVVQKTQMDVHARYVDPADGLAKTRYLTFQFLESCKAEDLMNNLTAALSMTTPFSGLFKHLSTNLNICPI